MLPALLRSRVTRFVSSAISVGNVPLKEGEVSVSLRLVSGVKFPSSTNKEPLILPIFSKLRLIKDVRSPIWLGSVPLIEARVKAK